MSSANREAADQVVQSTIIGFVTVAFVGVFMWLVGLQPTVVQLSYLLIFFVIAGVVTRRTTDFNVSFVILTLGILFMLTDFLVPPIFLEPFTPAIEVFAQITGVDVRIVDGFQWLVVGAVITAIALGARYRITGQRKFILPIVNAVSADFARFVDIYITSFRIAILLGLTAGIIVLQQTGILLGDLGGLAAQSPYFVSNLFTLLIGYLSLGGDLPIVGDFPVLGELTPVAFIVLGLLAIGVAAASASEGTGPISQFIDRL